ncbi:hypothetical protein OG884_18560 [Streptosporangium sp. NBC_01755]|uniref:hypothetical protein n=1 Tax=Streptosporangium sp. NBC_01755 TaxID=2975949 RepID=UPI002DD7A89B|nr:hypothetical protein [Streptosporangium sp. NBC_01755]WSD03810.1 hypothetical protein OG884_18560 [Streptosporangium sp. NBC_01755]
MPDPTIPTGDVDVLVSHEWTSHPRSAHRLHTYDAACAICRGDAAAIVAVVAQQIRRQVADEFRALAAAASRDDLRTRLDAILRPAMLIGLDDPLGEERAGEWADWVLAAVLAVRDVELEGARDGLADLDDIITTERAIHEVTIARAEEAEEALDAHKAALARVRYLAEDWATLPHGAYTRAGRRILAALDTPETSRAT